MSLRDLCQTFFFNSNKTFKVLAVLLFLFLGVSVNAQQLTIGDVSTPENVGSGNLVFTVTLTSPVLGGTQVDYIFLGTGTATVGNDYTEPFLPHNLTFFGLIPGETQNITIPIINPLMRKLLASGVNIYVFIFFKSLRFSDY